MPTTFTAIIAFDSFFFFFIQPGSSNSIMITANTTILDNKKHHVADAAAAATDVPPSPKLGRRHNTPTPLTIDRKYHWSQISPTLYATPDPTPLPTSPTSLSPSPYVINHKRRGPSLLLRRSYSHSNDAVAQKQAAVEGGVVLPLEDASVTVLTPIPTEKKDCSNLGDDGDDGSSSASSANGCVSRKDAGTVASMTLNLEPVNEIQDSSSIHSGKSHNINNNSKEEDNIRFGGLQQQYLNLATPGSEYFDAWDELSSESGGLQLLTLHHAEAELRETRLSLSAEIEMRNRAEERLNKMQCEWQKLREQLSLVGINLPTDHVVVFEQEEEEEDGSRQLNNVGRFVSDWIDRATEKIKMEMEGQIETKNIEIARLWDKLHYYETMSSEMSQRNQEAMENARKGGMKWQRRLWLWGSITAAAAAVVVVGAGVLGWSYLRLRGRPSTETNVSAAMEDHQTTSQPNKPAQ